jgi:hypothetical protein
MEVHIMPHQGFIKDELEIKLLVLYIMNRVAAPIDFFKLIDLALCDEGVDYFQLTKAISHLVETEHIRLEGDLYAITDKGRRNSQVCESSLPYSVRHKCDLNLAELNDSLRREAQVRSETVLRPDGTYAARLALDDEAGNLFTLELLAASEEHASLLCDRFRRSPERVYRSVLDTLLAIPGQEEESKKD